MDTIGAIECVKYRSVYLAAETERHYTGEKIYSPDIAADFIRPMYGETIQTVERIFALYLSTEKKPLAVHLVGLGSINACVCDPRVVAKVAIDTLAKSVILFHNHPSGSLEPSGNDIRLSEKLDKALNLFNCELDDHIIITEKGYKSLRGMY